jgi:hypothetical protein
VCRPAPLRRPAPLSQHRDLRPFRYISNHVHPTTLLRDAGWDLGVEKSVLGSRKQDPHQLPRDRNNPADISRLTGLVPWISKLLTAGGQPSMAL